MSQDKNYLYEEVVNASKDYFEGDDLAAQVFAKKYALQDNEGKYLEKTPADMHLRLAKEFARIESKYENPMSEKEIFNLFDKFKYIVPQGSPMSAIGNPYQIQSISNCFVVPSPLDSYGSILKADEQLAQISKRRGGVGINISNIRPKGLTTKNAAKTTDGVAVFASRFSNTIREVGQNGRRGALIISCSIHHPEIETFINMKRDLTKVTGANISVMITDEFMKAVKNNEDYEQRWPIDSKNPTVIKKVSAKLIWDQIISSAHSMAEPGVLFWDTIIKNSPADCYKQFGFETICVNPCAELTLSALDSCRLLLLNIFSYIKNPFTSQAFFDEKLFKEHAIKAQRLMDDLIDLELEAVQKIIDKVKSDPEPDDVKRNELELWQNIYKNCETGRRTGLGLTGTGDCLAALNLKYGSDESIKMTEKIYKTLAISSYESSFIMAKERGPFSIFSHELEKNNPFIKKILENCSKESYDLYIKYGRRNIANLTSAPAGSVSTQTQTTSGIEPLFSPKPKSLDPITRRRKINPEDKETKVDFVDATGDSWQEYTVYHKGIQTWMNVNNDNDATKSPYFGATSADIDWNKSVELQAAAQKYIDHSLSKTCNLPADTTMDVVADVYMKAYDSGCKGFTVYRDGCRSGVLVAKENKKDAPKFVQHNAPTRPKSLPCSIHSVKIKGESWTILVGLMENLPYEIFGGLSKYIEIPKKYKTGTIIKNGKKEGLSTYNLICGEGDDEFTIKDIVNIFENVNYPALTRTISLSLRHGAPLKYLIEQLMKDKYSDMQSFSRVVARVLREYVIDGTKSTLACSECGKDTLVFQEGCLRCLSCGNSPCS